jgi:hypothetical protein
MNVLNASSGSEFEKAFATLAQRGATALVEMVLRPALDSTKDLVSPSRP